MRTATRSTEQTAPNTDGQNGRTDTTRESKFLARIRHSIQQEAAKIYVKGHFNRDTLIGIIMTAVTAVYNEIAGFRSTLIVNRLSFDGVVVENTEIHGVPFKIYTGPRQAVLTRLKQLANRKEWPLNLRNSICAGVDVYNLDRARVLVIDENYTDLQRGFSMPNREFLERYVFTGGTYSFVSLSQFFKSADEDGYVGFVGLEGLDRPHVKEFFGRFARILYTDGYVRNDSTKATFNAMLAPNGVREVLIVPLHSTENAFVVEAKGTFRHTVAMLEGYPVLIAATKNGIYAARFADLLVLKTLAWKPVEIDAAGLKEITDINVFENVLQVSTIDHGLYTANLAWKGGLLAINGWKRMDGEIDIVPVTRLSAGYIAAVDRNGRSGSLVVKKVTEFQGMPWIKETITPQANA